jgi:N6-adenosine-specific RNA methylase IME4
MKYDVILADPPWHFRNYSGTDPKEVNNRTRGSQAHYPTMTTDELCTLPVADMAADNAVLFLWSCWPILPDSLRVIEAWGFEYKTLAWVWLKSNPSGFGFFLGMGYYTRSNTEFCLIATRGNPPKPKNRGIMSLIYAPVMEHSRKPDDQYRKIEALYPEMNYLELFAGRPWPGWSTVGNAIDGCDITQALQEATP